MTRLFVLALIAASLSTVVGCGARATSAADVRDESSWTPREEVAMSFAGSTTASNDKKEQAKASSMQPNRGQDRPTRGAVHAAAY